MPDTFQQGDTVYATATFTVGGTATDPTTVVFKYAVDGGSVTTKTYGSDGEVTKVSTGVFRCSIPVGAGKSVKVGAYGTGAAAGVVLGEFLIEDDPFT